MSKRSLSTVLIATVLAAGACGDAGTDDEQVLVLAAASLTDAFADLEAAFEEANPGIDVQVSVGASSALREQILEGAPADVFAAADPSMVEAVVDAGLAAGETTLFATNSLTVAVPIENPGGVRGPADLARPELKVGLCAAQVPCGILARQLLDAAGVTASVDTDEPNVRALLTKIAAGELDAGVVYATDVLREAEVEAVPTPGGVTARYPIVTLTDSKAAAAFVDFVTSEEGAVILARHGFGRP